MRIKIQGNAKNIHNKVIRYAAHFFAKCLISQRLSSKINVKIVFCELLKSEQAYGDAIFTKNSWRPRDFEIRLHHNMSKSRTLRVLAHEMVHVQQWAKGRMVDLSTGEVWFYKKNYSSTVMDKCKPWQLPWEAEAMFKEEVLLTFYKNGKIQPLK